MDARAYMDSLCSQLAKSLRRQHGDAAAAGLLLARGRLAGAAETLHEMGLLDGAAADLWQAELQRRLEAQGSWFRGEQSIRTSIDFPTASPWTEARRAAPQEQVGLDDVYVRRVVTVNRSFGSVRVAEDMVTVWAMSLTLLSTGSVLTLSILGRESFMFATGSLLCRLTDNVGTSYGEVGLDGGVDAAGSRWLTAVFEPSAPAKARTLRFEVVVLGQSHAIEIDLDEGA